ncbi:hypothetical protein DF186_22680, partial [Enterococcus hirae]
RGQAHETSVPMQGLSDWDALEERFGRIHAERNGFARAGDPIEVVTVRAAARAPPSMRWDDLPTVAPVGEARRGSRAVRMT